MIVADSIPGKVKKRRFKLLWLWLVAGLFGIFIFLIIAFNQPKFEFNYTSEQLAKPIAGMEIGGFFQPQMDASGNRYVWTQDKAYLIFQSQSLKLVHLTFEMRSAAVAGGPDVPVKVLANGVEVGELHPDPQNLNFQTLRLEFTPPPVTNEMSRTELKLELVTTTFKPGQSDSRNLGTMIKSIILDRSEVWSGVAKRLWMFWLLPVLAALALALFWLAKFYNSSLAGIVAVISGATTTIFVIILQIALTGVLADEKNGYEIWRWGGMYLWLLFGLSTIVIFLRQPLLERYYPRLVSEWNLSWPVALLVGLLSLYRLYLTIWAATPSGDETVLALSANQVLHCTPNPAQMVSDPDLKNFYENFLAKCGELPLVGGTGHLGFLYGPYPIYFSVLNYGLVNFNFAGAYLVNNLLTLLACWLLAATFEGGPLRSWVLLLGITSPLGVNLTVSFGVWNIFWFIPVTVAVLYFGRPSKTGSNQREFVVGILLGICLGLHPQSIPFVIGIGIWRNFVLRRFSWSRAIATGIGMFLSLLPYLIGLLLNLWYFTPKTKAIGFEDSTTNVLALFTSIYNFSGPQQQPAMINQEDQPWFSLGQTLASINLGVVCVLLLLTVIFIGFSYKKLRRLHPLVSGFLCCLFFYLVVGFFTNSVVFWHNNIPTWWFAPLMLPFVLLGLFPRRLGSALLVLLILFNLATTLIQYGPHPGTDIGSFYYYRPTYWMLQQTVSDTCQVARQTSKERMAPMVVYAKSGWLEWSMASLIAIKQPDCVSQIKFTEDYNHWDIFIEPTPKSYLYLIRTSKKVSKNNESVRVGRYSPIKVPS